MVQDLLGELGRRGIRLRLVDGRMDVVAPAGSLTPDLRERLGSQRDELIGLLRRAERGSGTATIIPDPERRHDPFPLTDIQHAYWIGRNRAVELGGVSTHYYFELDGAALDPARLATSLRRTVARHDMLRAVLDPDGRQRVLAHVPRYEIPVHDLRGRTESECTAARRWLRDEMAHQAPDPHQWPLFDIRLCLFDDEQTRLHVSVNMLIIDAGSLTLLFEDWSRWYVEPGWAPTPLPVTYRDYVLAVESLRAGGRYRADEEYWRDRLDALPPAPALPLATRPAQLAETVFTGRSGRLDEECWVAVKRTARRHGLTPSVVLMTAFADVLRMWSGQGALTLNVTLFHRPALHPDLDRIIGDFTSLTMLAIADDAGEPFAVRAGRLQRQLSSDLEHVGHSGVRVLQERARRLGGKPDAAMPVVFTSALGLGSTGDGGRPAGGHGRRLFGELVYSLSQTPQVWLDHQVFEEGGALLLHWDAVEALFPAGLLDDAFRAYQGLLDRLGRDERAWTGVRPLVQLPAWQAEERDRVNHTGTDLPAGTLTGPVQARAVRQPDAVAVIAADGRYTYGEVLRAGRRLARGLTALGAGAGTRVAVLLDKGREQVPAALGISLSRAAYLPIDPQWPAARREQVLALGGVALVVTSVRYRDAIAWPALVRPVTFDDHDIRTASDLPLAEAPTPPDLAYVMFTSGSTGEPKGVMIDHRGAANTIADINARFGIGPGDRVLALSALTFDLSVYDIFGVLAAGGAIVMPSSAGQRDPAEWSDLMRRHEVTVWNSVPALMQAWLEAHPPADGVTPTTLRLVLLSGDWIPVSLPDAIRAVQPAAEVISLGGATEASIWSVCHPVETVPAEWASIPYGRPLANQTLHVYDERLRRCPVWTAGEIHIGGMGLALGYWADPERSAQRFIIHPETGERLYRTGDLGRYLPGGDIEFLGRRDAQVKLNGYRIELGEIGAALRRCAGVAEALVQVSPNPGSGRRQLVAYVVPAISDRPAAPEQDRRWPTVVRAGTDAVERDAAELADDLSTLERWWRRIDELCPAVMARTLARIGAFPAAGAIATARDIALRCQVKPRYAGLIDQWLIVLAATGTLRPTGRPGEYRCDLPLDEPELDERVRAGLAAIDVTGADRVFVDYLVDCARRQVELLRGEVSPLQLLLPEGRGEVAHAVYAANASARVQNRVAAALVRAAVDSLPGPVSIVEIGAGTGATTAAVLPGLAARRVRYRFTDVSSYFTTRARRTFAGYPFLEYDRYDLDREPAGQGIAPGSVDIVVAANVLHDAKDLDRSLGHVRTMLAGNGILVAVEGTTNTRIQMISFGFIEGFGHHEGQRELPLLTVAQWRQRCVAAGFTRFAPVPDGPAVTEAMAQHVLAVQAPAGPATLDPTGLRAALNGVLPAYLVPQHYVMLDRLPLTANGKVDRSALPQPWDSAAGAEPVAARDPFERSLLRIWRQVLDRDGFGVEDNFFELGGDSMHALGVLGLLRDELEQRLTADAGLQVLFENPTVASLASALRQLGAGDVDDPGRGQT